MLGSHRERNPSRSENWHRRTTIYIPFARATPFSRIPRNSAAGDWRWRPRALRDKPTRHHYHHRRHRGATNPLTNTSSPSPRPRNFRWYERGEGGSVSSTDTSPLTPRCLSFIIYNPQGRYSDSRFYIFSTLQIPNSVREAEIFPVKV